MWQPKNEKTFLPQHFFISIKLMIFSCLILICLNFSDPPNVTVSSSAEGAVVEDEDSVSLKCEVDANPEAEITWRKEGDRRVLGNFPVLDIGVVSRSADMLSHYLCNTLPMMQN